MVVGAGGEKRASRSEDISHDGDKPNTNAGDNIVDNDKNGGRLLYPYVRRRSMRLMLGAVEAWEFQSMLRYAISFLFAIYVRIFGR